MSLQTFCLDRRSYTVERLSRRQLHGQTFITLEGTFQKLQNTKTDFNKPNA